MEYKTTESFTKRVTDVELELIKLFVDEYNPIYWGYDVRKMYYDFLESYMFDINDELVDCLQSVRHDIEEGHIHIKHDKFPEFNVKLKEFIITHYVSGIGYDDWLNNDNLIMGFVVRIPEECCYKVTVVHERMNFHECSYS